MTISPIKTEADYQQALAEIEQLFGSSPNTQEGDRLEVLTTLVEAYEVVHHSVPPPDPIEAILYYLESRGLSQSDLESIVGNKIEAVDILDRRRLLTIEVIRRLHSSLGIPAEILIQPYELRRSAA
jgi:HTH-type transcriptional regulator / antitoxin HigA